MKSRERSRTPKYIQMALWNEGQYPLVEAFRCVSVKIPDDDAYLPVLMALVGAAGNYWNYQSGHSARAKNDTERAKAFAVAALWEKAFSETDWSDCMACCDDILAALEALSDKVNDVQNDVNDIKQAQSDNAATYPQVSQSVVTNEICGGATAVVEAMNEQNTAAYNDTEAGATDTVFELVAKFMAAIPIFGALPFDELFALVDWYFEHQVEVYAADYETAKQGMIDALACLITANGGQFNFDVWGDWLNSLSGLFPGNAAAGLFARYAPVRQTFLNQIAALLNKDNSLQSYFDTLAVAYTGGLVTPVACGTCPCYLWDFNISDGGWTLVDGNYGALPDETVGYYSEVVGSETLVSIDYTFASPENIAAIDLSSFHADMYITIIADSYTAVNADYRPAAAIDEISYTINRHAVTTLKIRFVRTVPDSYLDLRSVKITYTGPEPTGGDACI